MRIGKSIAALIYAALLLAHQQSAHAGLTTCITAPISSKPVLPQMKFSELDCLDTLQFSGTPGEFIAGSVTVRSGEPVADLEIRIDSIVNSRKVIAGTAIDVRYVKPWYQTGGAWQTVRQNNKAKTLVPELLLRNPNLIKVDEDSQKNFLVTSENKLIDINSTAENSNTEVIPVNRYPIKDSDRALPATLAANRNQQIWLTLQLPATAEPGQYQGKLRVLSAQKPVGEIPFSVTVYPFALAQPELIYSIYYRGILTEDGQGSISSENKTIAQMTAELNNMKAHGIANPTIYQAPEPASLFEKVLSLRSAAGLDNSTLYYLGITTGNPEATALLQKDLAIYKQLQTLSKKYGTDKILIYGIDEAEPHLIPKQKNAWSKYREAGGDIFAADWRSGAEQHYAGEISSLILGSEPDSGATSYLQAKGTKAFLYNQPQVGVEDPYIYRLQYGITAWRKGFNGAMNYAYQHAMGDIWNDFDHPQFRDHVFAYPTADGVIDTIAWEGFREAVTDVKYISTLNKLARLSDSKEDLLYLSALKTLGASDLDGMRENIAKRISSLCSQRTPSNSAQICIPSPPTQIRRIEANEVPN